MVRRQYEEDSSVEDAEDYPLYRTPRLHGGLAPSEEENTIDSEGTVEGADKNSSGDESEYFTASEGLSEKRVSSVDTALIDTYKYLQRLYYPDHKYEDIEKRVLQHRCRICRKDRLSPKVQCTQCKMYVHSECKSDPKKKNDIPRPCIHPTPMSDINEPDLKESLIYLPAEIPRVPAILVKCFYELQAESRIKTKDLYKPFSRDCERYSVIRKLCAKLRRQASRNLDFIQTWLISECVLLFLADVRGQIIRVEDADALRAIKKRHCADPYLLREKVVDYVEEHIVEHYRLQTLAAVMLHLHTVEARAKENLMTRERIIHIFIQVLDSIDSLFVIEPTFWFMKLIAANVAVEPPPTVPSLAVKAARLFC